MAFDFDFELDDAVAMALVGPCDECGLDLLEDCECIFCSECEEVGPGGATIDQDEILCESCAWILDEPLITGNAEVDAESRRLLEKEKNDDS